MAFQLKHWLGIVALSCVLIAVWRLPLDYVGRGPAQIRSASEVRYSALEAELRDARMQLDQVRRAEALPTMTSGQAESGLRVIIPDRFEVDAESAALLRERLLSELRDLGTRDPAMGVGYAYDGGDGGSTGLAVSQGHRVETYLTEQGGAPLCLQVVVTRTNLVRSMVPADADGSGWNSRTGSLLGPCAVYAKHGLAGPAIQDWLEGGGMDFARARGAAPEGDYNPLLIRRRTFMAIRLRMDPGSSMESERCHTGSAEVCAQIFLDPDRIDRAGARYRRVTRGSPAAYAWGGGGGAFPFVGWFLFSDLEREFGSDAFRRFWTSDAEVRPAFEAAFGVDLGEWLLGWLEERWGSEPATPAPTLSATFGSLLLVSLMTGLAAYVQRRRRVA